MAKLTELKPEPAPTPTPPPPSTAPPPPPPAGVDPIESLQEMLTSPAWFNTIAILLLISETFLCIAIIRLVPYTEIDWSTYMQQVELFLNGERDYSLLKGDTGPIVYPASFLYVYSGLYYLTNKGKDLRIAQYIFAQIYVVTLGMIFVIYKRCGSVPPYALVFLTLSKRLHSIYVLRMFNDGIAMLFMYGAVLAWTSKRPRWTLGCIIFSVALGVKMNLLLFLPGLLFLLFTHRGVLSSLPSLLSIILVQILLASPFLSSYESATTYFGTAFNLSREFLWEWTVNWRWLGEEAFVSKGLSSGLLVAHVVVVVLFAVRWSEDEGGVVKVLLRGLRKPTLGPAYGRPSPDHVVVILFASNLVGILFARSLHYQFYAWYAHQMVFLAWHTPFDVIQRVAMLVAIEYGWNVFPSTLNSSMGLTFTNAFLLAGVYYGQPTGVSRGRRRLSPDADEDARKTQ